MFSSKVQNNQYYYGFPCISAMMSLKKVIAINSLIAAKNYNMNFLCKRNKSTQTAASLLFIITNLWCSQLEKNALFLKCLFELFKISVAAN